MLRFGYSPSRGCLFESCPRPADLGIIGLPDTLSALAGWGDFARAPNPSPLRVAIAEVSAGLEPAAAFTGKPIQCGTFCRSFPAVILLRASRRTARNTIINMKRYSTLKARKPLPNPEAYLINSLSRFDLLFYFQDRQVSLGRNVHNLIRDIILLSYPQILNIRRG